MATKRQYKYLDADTMKEIRQCVRECIGAEEIKRDAPEPEFVDFIISATNGRACLDEKIEVLACYREKTSHLLNLLRNGEAPPELHNRIALEVSKMERQGERNHNSHLVQYAIVLALRYISPEKHSIRAIAQSLGMTERTVLRNIHDGIGKLAILLFGERALKRK